jgi:hypothetical protein
LLKILKRNAKFSKTTKLGRKSSEKKKKTKKNLGHRPLFLSPIGQILAHKENAGWIEDQNFRSHLMKKFINE